MGVCWRWEKTRITGQSQGKATPQARKDCGVAGVHEGTVISLPRKGSPFYRIRLDKDDEDDDTVEEDMTWSELAAVTKQQACCTARTPAAASPVFLFSVASFCTGMRR